MTKMMKRFALVLCLVALCVGMMSVAALAAYEPVTATVPVTVALSGTLPATPDTFQVELTAEEEGNPMPAGAVNGVYVLDVQGGTTAALNIEFSKLGVYNYTVKQLDLGNPDCYQDTHTYKVTAFVTNNADYSAFDLVIVVYRDDSTDKWDEIVFENRYANPDYVQIVATKKMDGKTPKDGAFTFELVDEAGAVVETVANDAKGDILFSSMICNKIGSTSYTLREVAGTDKKVIYDETEYTATVDVVKDDNGDYVGSVTYKQGVKDLEQAPNFANKTKPDTPNTGDDANMLLWGGIMVVALAGIVVLLLTMKRRKQA